MPCTDIPGWTDSFGYSCLDYEVSNFCNATGGYGIGWDPLWGTFADYQNQGFIGTDACCVCGGGLKGVCMQVPVPLAYCGVGLARHLDDREPASTPESMCS